MHLARPFAAIIPTLDGEVLVVLAGTTRPLTGRDVAKLVKRGSQAGVNRALRRLVEHGVVEAQEAGAAILYSLNREHLAAPAVSSLADLRGELVRRLRQSQLDQLARDVRRWTGNQLGLAEVSKRDVRRLRRIKPAVLFELRADAVTLVGPPVSELLRRGG